jgi:hypothetical protein
MVGTGGNICLYEPAPTKMMEGIQDPSTMTMVVVEGSLGDSSDCAQEVPFIPEGSEYNLSFTLLSTGKGWNGNPYYNYTFSGKVKTNK